MLELKTHEIKSLAQATSAKLVVLASNKQDSFDSIYVLERDQQPLSLVKIPLLCNLLDPKTTGMVPSLRFSALKMLKTLDDSVLLFDQ